MKDIPDDVMKAAEATWDDMANGTLGRVQETAVIARAIMAERAAHEAEHAASMREIASLRRDLDAALSVVRR